MNKMTNMKAYFKPVSPWQYCV